MMRTTQLRCARWTIALTLAELLCCCGGAPGSGLPSQVSNFPADLKDGKLAASGIYDDGWLAETASVNLRQPAGKQAIAVRGTVPKIGAGDFTTDVAVMVNGREVARRSVGIGDFQVAGGVPDGAGVKQVSVTFSKSQELPGSDGRIVGAHAALIGFVSAKSVEALTGHDIVRGAEVRLGSGWGVLETFRDETFRWVNNDAQVLITPDKGGGVALALLVEAGPGVGGKCLLKALDASGRQVATAPVKGRASVKLFVPVEAGKTNEFRLHVDGGGRPAKGDQRVLNFRVFQVAGGA